MRHQQLTWTGDQWSGLEPADITINPQLGLFFGNVSYFQNGDISKKIKKEFPDIILVGCSTAGEIANDRVLEGGLVFTAIEFEKSEIKAEAVLFDNPTQVYEVGKEVAQKLPQSNLNHVIVLSEGIDVNGSKLVDGITEMLPPDVQLTGGLAGDDNKFEKTFVLLNGESERNKVVLIGFYGEPVEVGYGCVGGWDPFGPNRLITESQGNILYKLDDQPALDLYKKYLGDYADKLPSSGLLFPLCIVSDNQKTGLVRTILGVDETTKSLIFAGDVPEGEYAKLMKANHYGLIDGASKSAQESILQNEKQEPDLAIVFSCVGRKLVLKQQVEEELEVLREVYGSNTLIAGFYSYGEIAPREGQPIASLHNQTMCITTISEM